MPWKYGKLCCALMALPTVVLAGGVNENEANGAAANNGRATAQNISTGTFTTNASADVLGTLPTANVFGHLGGDDVDFFSFSTGGGLTYFSTTRTTGGLDTYLALFSAAGTLLGDNDDAFPIGPGASATDSFLGSFNLSAGTYYIAITSNKNSALASFTGSSFTELMRPDGGFGGFAFGNADTGVDGFLRNSAQLGGSDYTLNISIPAPGASMLAAIAGVSFGGRRRRG